MNHPETVIAGLYDHQQEQALEPKRRAPDWGGDELFTSAPRRRRLEREAPTPDRPGRRAAHESADPPPPAASRAAPEAPRLALEVIDTELARRYQRAPNGRRTITVTGHPGATAARTHRPLGVEHRRPGRSLEHHFAARPDRIAAWAFGLGLLLIVISILTAQA